MNANENVKQTPTALVIAAWLFVGVPLAWGVYQTFIKSLTLFQ